MKENPVTIKGTKDGLLVILGDENWDTVLGELEEHLVQTAAFFAGGQVILQLGERALAAEELETISNLLNQHGLTLTTVLSETADTRRAAQRLGYETARPQRQPARRPVEAADGLVVRRTLRSGQSVRHPGSVIIIGDVNPGAEVVAGGDVIVWGHLRGMVHAGALGDNQALVCALSLAPTQLRIGNQIARPPEDQTETPQPEMARVENDMIVVEGWGD
ncbi:MAG: septum site-determining protein MinC [Chloroflexi bacterium]|nr:MAG: septum site-determining protein MinC [Chloroflexota bacterium]